MIDFFIKTEKDYEYALDSINKLMDAELGTYNMIKLILLTLFVERYEDIHYQI